MNYLRLSAVLVLLLTALGCSRETAPLDIKDDVQAVANGGNEFATDLYARLRLENSANLFFSPYSVSTALAMTYAGAEGQTKAQMAKVLHFPLPDARLHPAFNTLRNRLEPSDKMSGFQLRVANRLWGQAGFQFLPKFLHATNANYGADLGLLDFKQTDAARNTINSWVEEQTDHKIRDLLVPGAVDASTRLVLTNAIYFKANWTHEFHEDATSDAAFHISDSEQIDVPTMHQRDQHRYGVLDNIQILQLPYAGEGNLAMLILLPKKLDGLSYLESRLTWENLQKWPAALQYRLVDVSLPKFKITSQIGLKDVLESMGMNMAFSDTADFSGMSDQQRLFLSAVIHKAFVDVNEAGTEAAAATAIGAPGAAMGPAPEEPVEFRADHPFVFLIRDNRTESVLFMGRVANPKSQE